MHFPRRVSGALPVIKSSLIPMAWRAAGDMFMVARLGSFLLKRVCMKSMKLGACVAALSLLNAPVAQARTNCATAAEISAVQISAVQQELTDAALACGPVAVANFNRFQTVFGPELRK